MPNVELELMTPRWRVACATDWARLLGPHLGTSAAAPQGRAPVFNEVDTQPVLIVSPLGPFYSLTTLKTLAVKVIKCIGILYLGLVI